MNPEWEYYVSAMEGVFVDELIQRGNPQSGFYRDKNRAVGIWRADGKLVCKVSTGFQPTKPDQIDDLFGACCRHPISRDLFVSILNGGAWPEAVDPRPADEPPADISSADGAMAEIESFVKRWEDWFASLPNGVATDVDDAKTARYADELAAIGRQAEATHKAEKQYWLEGGRKVDAAWNPVIKAAGEARRRVLAPALEFRVKRDAEERAKREAEIERMRAEQRERIDAGERPAPIQAPPKKASGLRSVKEVEITDLKALALQIASSNDPDPDFFAVLKKIARRLIESGVAVEGARIVTTKRAA